MNPIEEAFSKVKSYLKANDPYIQVVEDSEIPNVITAVFASITSDDCYSWVEHSGHMNTMDNNYTLCVYK